MLDLRTGGRPRLANPEIAPGVRLHDRIPSLVPTRLHWNGQPLLVRPDLVVAHEGELPTLAEVRVDAYPGLVLKGHVAAIGAGTGSEFSVLPAQNASGNWVKVTQRVPVRIALDQSSPHQLIAGLSVKAKVFTDEGKR